MNTRLRAIGNSKGVIINAKDLYKAGLNIGDTLSVKSDKGKIVLTKA